MWAVDELVDIKMNEAIPMGMNLLSFDADGTCSLPALLAEKMSSAKWNLSTENNGNVILKIECEARPQFNGNYTLSYESIGYLNKLTLRSSSIQMICTSQD